MPRNLRAAALSRGRRTRSVSEAPSPFTPIDRVVSGTLGPRGFVHTSHPSFRRVTPSRLPFAPPSPTWIHPAVRSSYTAPTPWDDHSVFIFQHNDSDAEIGRLLRALTEQHGFGVLLDVDDLDASPFDTQLVGWVGPCGTLLMIRSPE